MSAVTHANSASYPQRDWKRVVAKMAVAVLFGREDNRRFVVALAMRHGLRYICLRDQRAKKGRLHPALHSCTWYDVLIIKLLQSGAIDT